MALRSDKSRARSEEHSRQISQELASDPKLYFGVPTSGPRADVVRGAIEACRLEARKPAGVRLGGGGDAVRAEKVAIRRSAAPDSLGQRLSSTAVYPPCPRTVPGNLDGCNMGHGGYTAYRLGAAQFREAMSHHLRIARPVRDLEKTASMYCRGLGLRVIGRFEDHDGFDGVMLGLKGSSYHFEFTHHRIHSVLPSPTPEDLLVFYVAAPTEWQTACARMLEAGFKQVSSF